MADAADRRGDRESTWHILAALVRDEYPDGLSLAEIARRWGDADVEAIAALERLEAPEGLDTMLDTGANTTRLVIPTQEEP
jgi:hypothetical protein